MRLIDIPKGHFAGRSRKQKICRNQDFVSEELKANGKTYKYKQVIQILVCK